MNNSSPVDVVVLGASFYIRNVRVRIPFRYGNACLLGSPILHCRLRARGADGTEAEGISADALPPRWFDKDPGKPYEQNVADLLTAVQAASAAYTTGRTAAPVFEHWRAGYKATQESVRKAGLNALIGSFGSSILERALIDATGKLMNQDFHTCLRHDSLGIRPEAVHGELSGRSLADAVGASPRDRVAVRHTLGLTDPIFEADRPVSERVNDGLPETLEEWIREVPFSYFKVKIYGELDQDAPRLERLAQLLEAKAPGDYRISLDGNENFGTPEQLGQWLHAIRDEAALKPLMARIAYIEQPLDRAHALSETGAASFAGMDELPPVIIDESDDEVDAFKRAHGLGYRGTSVKSCKGPIKGLLNRMLVDYYNETENETCLLTGEDLTTIPVIPLQQDLSLMRVLRLDHLERNGHHYYRGLDHVPESERRQCIAACPSLYTAWGNSARLRMEDGVLDLSSLTAPGLGVGIAMDWEQMTPLEDWRFESLGIA